AMMARVAAHAPAAKLEGALVARMIEGGVETVIGAKRDAIFGPVVVFGLGGVYVAVLKDVTLRLAPVDRAAANPEVASAEVNPFIALSKGGVAVDALIMTE